MPELPEVETVRDGLARHVLGRTVTGVAVRRDYSVRRHADGPLDFVGRLRGVLFRHRLQAVTDRWLAGLIPEIRNAAIGILRCLNPVGDHGVRETG